MIKEAPPAHGKEDRINGKNAKVNRTRKQERCRQLLIPCAKQMHKEGMCNKTDKASSSSIV